jgi:hypothetical protein
VPFCISRVAAVCRKVCGDIPGPSPASLTALLNAVLTEVTGFPLNSTKCFASGSILCQRMVSSSEDYGKMTSASNLRLAETSSSVLAWIAEKMVRPRDSAKLRFRAFVSGHRCR